MRVGRGSRAGASASVRFRRARWATIRADWRDWVVLGAILVASAVTIAVADGWLRVIAAMLLGFAAATVTVGWLIGGHVSNLTWSWGAEGERRTEALLRELGPAWHVEHDIPDGRGNWDHVVVGPPGVFVIDSKAYHQPATVVGDELRSGRVRTVGGVFRGSAVRLKKALEHTTGRSTWVQAAVVVHGELSQGTVLRENVLYVEANHLVEWLQAQRVRLDDAERASLVDGVRAMRERRGHSRR